MFKVLMVFRIMVFWFLVLLVTSCGKNEENKFSFYHWKNKTELSTLETTFLKDLKVEEIYVRFFDIVVNEINEAHPISVVKELDEGYKKFVIIPVVFITNKTFKKTDDVLPLANKVKELVNQMYQHHYDTIANKIQIDCDWTALTKDKYFEFLSILKKDFQMSVTIRLHQVKFQDRTGVPPVDEGSLMVYNMGDLKDTLENSIFSLETVKKYIFPKSQYPFSLDIALPLYSWGIVKFPDDQIKIINNLTKDEIQILDTNFRQINEITFEVMHPHFLKGFFLPHKTILKVEEIDFDQVIVANKYLKSCNEMDWNNTMFYHLDEEVLQNYSVDQLQQLLIN